MDDMIRIFKALSDETRLKLNSSNRENYVYAISV